MLRLEDRVKKGFIALAATVMLSPIADTFVPLHFQNSSNLYAQSQENGQKKKSSFFEEYSKKEKKKADVKKYELQPVDINVYDKDGSFYRSYKNISAEKSKSLTIKIPEGGRVELLTKSNYPECIIDMMIKEDVKDQAKPQRLTNPRTNGYAFQEYMDISSLGLKAGTKGNVDFLLEPIRIDLGLPRQLKSITVDYEIIQRLPAQPKQTAPDKPEQTASYKPRAPGKKRQPDMEEENKQFVPRGQPRGRSKKEHGRQGNDLSRIILGIGTEDIGQGDKSFDSFEADAYLSFNEKSLLHFNAILNHLNNPLDECAEENVNITNLRAGGLFSPVKGPVLGFEGSYSSSNRTINFYSPFILPQSAGSNSNLFLLGKAGFTNGFGRNTIALLGVGGIQSQKKTLYDECRYVCGEQDGLNLVYGGEAFIDLGRDKKSKVALYFGGNMLFFKPLGHQDAESIGTLTNGMAYNIKAMAHVKVSGNIKLGFMAGYGKSDFTYGLHHKVEQDRTSIKGSLIFDF